MAPGTTLTAPMRSRARRSKFWLVMYSSACQRVQRLTRLPTLALPATAPTFGFSEVRHHACDGVGGDDGVGVDADEEFRVADMFEAIVESLGFAAVGLGEDEDPAVRVFGGKSRRATSRVRSFEPSSMTMTRRLG